MLDLGDTLVKDDEVLPFVTESLAALRSFQIQDGSALSMCLVSDFHLAQPFTPQRVDEIFGDYVQLLTQFGLSEFFEPLGERVTLSTHANVFKPDRAVFELALQRLGGAHRLDECLFITENEAHIDACRGFGMETLTFGATDPEAGFDDWSVGLMLIANRFAANNLANLRAAFPVWAKAHQNCDYVNVVDVTPSGRLTANGQCWAPVTGTADSGLEGVNVQLPVSIEVTLDEWGLPREFIATEPDEDTLTEVTAFVDSLAVHDQITDKPDEATPQQTHYVERQSDGRKFLKRRGFN
jgi:hypothetical protein